MDLNEKLSSSTASPQKVLKIVIGFSVVLLLMWLFTLSEVGGNGKSSTSAKDITSAEKPLKTVLKDSAEIKAKKKTVTSGDSPGLFSGGLLTFLVLLAILAGVWFWVDRNKSGKSQGVHREIGSQMLGEGARLKIIEINSEVWVLGVTSTSVDLLHRYSQNEWIEKASENGEPDEDTFAGLLKNKIG